MGMATGIRIVQGILAGSINGAALQTLLGTPANRASWQMVINSRSQARVIAESATAMTAVNGSAYAAADLVASSVAVAAAGASFVAQTVIGSSGPIFSALAANEPKYTSYIGSLVNFDAAAAQLSTVAGLLGNTSARTAVFASPRAISVVCGAPAGRSALVSVHAAFISIFETDVALRALAPTAVGAFNAQASKATTVGYVQLTGTGAMGRWRETITNTYAATAAGGDSSYMYTQMSKGRDYVNVGGGANAHMATAGVFTPPAAGYTLWVALSPGSIASQRFFSSATGSEGFGTDAAGNLVTLQAGAQTARGASFGITTGWKLVRLRKRGMNECYIKIDGRAESADLGAPPNFAGGVNINAMLNGGSISTNPSGTGFGTVLMLSNPGGTSGAADAEIDAIQDLLEKQYLA